MAAAGEGYTARDYLDALDTIAAMRQAFEDFFGRYDFLITPATAAMPWPAAQSHPRHRRPAGRSPRPCGLYAVCNALGLPAISLPCVMEDGALPVGLQVIAGSGHDGWLMKFAREYEGRLSRATDGRMSSPGV